MELRIGKASVNVLDRSVMKRLGSDYCEASIWQAAAAGGRIIVSDPVTLACKDPGRLAAHEALNGLAARGAAPETLTSVVLLPAGSKEALLRQIEDEIAGAARETGARIAGGHTEVTTAVTRPVVTVTAAGSLRGDLLQTAAAPAPGMDIVMSGAAGMEGTWLLVTMKRAELEKRFPPQMIETACRTFRNISILQPLELAFQTAKAGGFHIAGAVNLSEGGVMAGLWKLSTETGNGFCVSLPDIPVLQDTIEFTEHFGINPYCMESSGSVLLVTEDGAAIAEALNSHGFGGTVIGHLAAGRGKVLMNGDEAQNLNRPEPDSLLALLG